MQRLMNFPNQAAVAQLMHLIDERHQGGDSLACMPSFACRGRVRLLT
jgi:hypothetical protein